jgi:hypothetical protein
MSFLRRSIRTIRGCGSRAVLAMLGLGVLIAVSAGCASLSDSQDTPGVASPPTQPPTPAAPPAPPRSDNARIADEESLKKLIQGKTTKAEVRERFGIPREMVVSPGVETFIYYRDQASGWFSRSTDRVEMLTIRFDTRGILKDFEYRYSGK